MQNGPVFPSKEHVRLRRILAIRQALACGTYHVQPTSLAEAILRHAAPTGEPKRLARYVTEHDSSLPSSRWN